MHSLKSESEIIRYIEAFSMEQRLNHYPCPRCGKMRMNDNVLKNALSRQANIQICDICGNDEALQICNGNGKSLADWAIVTVPMLFEKK